MPALLPRRAYVAIGEILTHPRFHPIHRRLYRWTGGRGPLGRVLGMDMILVTMTGRKTGLARVVPLAAIRHGTTRIVVGSNAGKPQAPAWVHNLRADPDVVVEHRATAVRHRAHEAEGDEADRLWGVVTSAYPGYQVYRDRTDRPIALFVLEPVGDA